MGFFNSKKELLSKTGDGELINVAVVFVHGLGGGRETWRIMTDLLQSEWSNSNDFKLNYFHKCR